MDNGIDKQFVQEYYGGLTDQEIIRVLSQNAHGLTQDALDIVKEEVARRNLGPEILSIVDAQQQTFDYESKVYNPDEAPVDEAVRIWLENAFLKLLNFFGEENTRNRTVLLPERIHFPIKYDGSERCAFETVRILAGQMEVPAERIKLDFYDDNLQRITEGTPAGMYWGKGENNSYEISLAREQIHKPEEMIATLSHEIAHIKLLGENRMTENDEFMTDLTTVFFGLGVFSANSAFQTSNDARNFGWSRAGYLSQMEWGYALALFAYIRQEQDPVWMEYLNKNVRADLEQSWNFIMNNEDEIFKTQGS